MFDLSRGPYALKEKAVSAQGAFMILANVMRPILRRLHHSPILLIVAFMLVTLAWSTPCFAGDDDLVAAAAKGDLPRIKALLEANTDVNMTVPSGATALIAASQAGQIDAVRLLLSAKADVDARVRDGRTALILASGRGHLDVVRLLLSAKADVNAHADDGSTALMWASQGGHADVVQALIAGGADVNAEDKHGRTALIGASYNGYLDVVKALLAAKGIKPNAVTSTGATALEAAGAGGHADVRSLLVKASATATQNGNDKRPGNKAEVLKDMLAPPARACFAVVHDVSSCKGLTCTPIGKKESLANCYSLSADRAPNFDDAFYQIYIASCHSGEAVGNEIPLFGAETLSGPNIRYARGFSPPVYCRWRADPGTEPTRGVQKDTNIAIGQDQP